jgi:hypothetical protein
MIALDPKPIAPSITIPTPAIRFKSKENVFDTKRGIILRGKGK